MPPKIPRRTRWPSYNTGCRLRIDGSGRSFLVRRTSCPWYEETAEIMLQLRAQVISQRWDDGQSDIRALTRKDARTGWRQDPRAMRCKDEANPTSNIYSLLYSAQPRPQSGNAPRRKSQSRLALLRSAPHEQILACIAAIGAAGANLGWRFCDRRRNCKSWLAFLRSAPHEPILAGVFAIGAARANRGWACCDRRQTSKSWFAARPSPSARR